MNAPRYYINPGPTGSNSYSVFDRTKKNAKGTDVCVLSLVTLLLAVTYRDSRNGQRYLNTVRGFFGLPALQMQCNKI